jgi:hypothetical protein
MKIFYSWQSDTPAKIGKIFIRGVLDRALEKINVSMGLDEAERPFVDQDTQGVMGAPAIADTIFEKIRTSQVIVADVTLVGKVDQNKKLINSNVGIELGFTLGHHGDSVMLAVMNTHYGSPGDLPFVLSHRRWPVCFNLSPDASKATRGLVREKLADKFSDILREYIESGQSSPKRYERVPSTDNPAMYWNSGEPLIDDTLNTKNHTVPLQLGYTADQPLIYMRIWPDTSLKELTASELIGLREKRILPLLERDWEGMFDRNRYGMISYSGRKIKSLMHTTQIFKNKEIWGVDAWALSASKRSKTYEFNFLTTAVFERGIRQSLTTYLDTAVYFGYSKIVHIEVGLVNIKGFRLLLPSPVWGEPSHPIFEDVLVKTTTDLEGNSTYEMAISQIFNKVYEAWGHEWPVDNDSEGN